MLPFIHTAVTWYAPGRDLTCRLADRALALYPPRALPYLQPLLVRRGDVATNDEITAVNGVPPIAYVDAGRWTACCPFCGSAQVVSPDDPFYLCAGDDGCLNVKVGGAYVNVSFPDPETVIGIESVLIDRPEMPTRNWLPHEMVADLLVENITRDVTAPDVTLDQLIVQNLAAQTELLP